MNRNPKYQNIPFPMFPLVLWWWNKGQLGSWRREQLSEALASWCTSSSVTKWLFLCAAALTDILHCTVYSPNSRKLPCRVQRPAGAGGGLWLVAFAPGNSRVNGGAARLAPPSDVSRAGRENALTRGLVRRATASCSGPGSGGGGDRGREFWSGLSGGRLLSGTIFILQSSGLACSCPHRALQWFPEPIPGIVLFWRKDTVIVHLQIEVR